MKYLVNPRIKFLKYYPEEIVDYIDKVHFYKEGEYGWRGCGYIRDEYYWGNNPPFVEAKEVEILPFLFDTEEEAIIGVKSFLEEVILEYEETILRLKKIISPEREHIEEQEKKHVVDL